MDDQEFHRILQKYLQEKCTPAEKKAVENFYQRNQQKELLADYSEAEERKILELIKAKVFDQIKIREVKKPKPWATFAKIAASLTILIALSFWLSQNFTSEKPVEYLTKTTQRGQKSTITLSDGSTIRLNAESSVTYPASFSMLDTRTVQLNGEAFFTVKRNTTKPFVVETSSLQTTVLGTSFNVKAYHQDEVAKVTVASGKVQVASAVHFTASSSEASTKSLFLVAGEQAAYQQHTQQLNKAEVSLESFLAWKDDLIIFDDISLHEATRVLERWFDVEIQLQRPELGECYINGSYQSEQLVNILESMKFVNGITYEFQSDRKIVIAGTECKN